MEELQKIINALRDFVWGPVMLVFLVGTGVFLTIKLKFLPWRNLGSSLKRLFSKESRRTDNGEGDISPFSALMTALAATVGTGNIVGVATAMVTGGPGALVWMWISAAFGISTKYAECTLALKYRETNEKGEIAGGPMYTLKKAFKNKKLGAILAGAFALFTVIASFGIGNATQANSISSAVNSTFSVPKWLTGIILVVLTAVIVLGGIKSISKVSSVLVPAMAAFYIIAGIIVVLINYKNIPSGLATIFSMAFGGKAVAGGIAGTITASVMQSMRYGIARGVFSNEAGLGSAAISAASATSDHHVRQGYINMCGTFIDTIIVCTITGLAIASSGVLGAIDPSTGKMYEGAQLTIAAFESALGKAGGVLVTIGIILFAFSTILGWEYNGEKALEFLLKKPVYCYIYRVVFSLIVFVGATLSLDIVWSFSDIANGLMSIPNLISLIALSGVLAKDTIEFQKTLKAEKEQKKAVKQSK
ncbi:MAG: alanine/glycine:cation symporter family protein [Eubacterium sp.]